MRPMIDLHMHSLYSDDGELTPLQLVARCKTSNISLMSITDHNCARANNEAEGTAKKNGIAYVPGIEIDCVWENTNFHVLGYGIDYKSTDFAAIERYMDRQCFRASLEMLEKTQILGFHVTENEMWQASRYNYRKDIWNGELFATVLLTKPEFSEHPLLKPYQAGGSRSDNPYVNFYRDFYSPGKPCHASIAYPDMKEIIDIIHQNHGVAILAHPGTNPKIREALLHELLALELDGVEAFSSHHTPEQAAHYSTFADKHSLLTTCGSDYHGKVNPSVILGHAVFAENMNPEEKATQIGQQLLARIYCPGSKGKQKTISQ